MVEKIKVCSKERLQSAMKRNGRKFYGNLHFIIANLICIVHAIVWNKQNDPMSLHESSPCRPFYPKIGTKG